MSKPTLRLFSHLDNAMAVLAYPGRGYLHVEIERGHVSSRVIANWNVLIDGQATSGALDYHTTPEVAIRQAAALFRLWSAHLLDS